MLVQLGFRLSQSLSRFEDDIGQGIAEYMFILALCVALLTIVLSSLTSGLSDFYAAITDTLGGIVGS
jgi:hypothetical protein